MHCTWCLVLIPKSKQTIRFNSYKASKFKFLIQSEIHIILITGKEIISKPIADKGEITSKKQFERAVKKEDSSRPSKPIRESKVKTEKKEVQESRKDDPPKDEWSAGENQESEGLLSDNMSTSGHPNLEVKIRNQSGDTKRVVHELPSSDEDGDNGEQE